MKYSKPPLTFEEQADLILSRGLIANREELIYILKNVNYYRLSAYLYPYRNTNNTFKKDTTLKLIWRHYTFDRQLRIIVMDAVERVEVSIKTQLIYHFAHKYGPFGYLDNTNLPKLDFNKFNYLINDLRSETKRSRETFKSHFVNKYGDEHNDLPIWMLVEIMSFGKILTLFNGVEDEIRRKIAREYSIEDRMLQSWLGAINVIRNICAHHGRLWNRELGYKPIIPREKKYPEWHNPAPLKNNRIFIILTILKYFINKIAKNSKWDVRLKKLLNEYSNISIKPMGFPDNWNEYILWKK